jgi:acyl-CoA synthetase (NDP forming)
MALQDRHPAPVFDTFDRAEIRRIVERVLSRGAGWVLPEESLALLAAAGIESAASRVASDVDTAARTAAELGFPVAVKALGPTLLHKTERKAVCLNVADDAALRATYADLSARFGRDMTAVMVSRWCLPAWK